MAAHPPLTPEQREQVMRRLHALGRLLDDQFEIPGTNLRFGLDPLLGVLPGGGDAISALISAYIIYEAKRLGVSKRTMMRMVGNAGIDLVIGVVPFLGDLFDFGFKANRRNLRLLGIRTEEAPPAPGQPGWNKYRVVAEQ